MANIKNINLGTNQLQNIYLGNTNITHVYIGNVLVYQNTGDNGYDIPYGNLVYSSYDTSYDIYTGIDLFDPRKTYTIVFNAKEKSSDFILYLAYYTKLVYKNSEKKLDLQLSNSGIGMTSKGKVPFKFNKDYVFIFSPDKNNTDYWKCTLLDENVPVFDENLKLLDNTDFSFRVNNGSFNKFEVYEEV